MEITHEAAAELALRSRELLVSPIVSSSACVTLPRLWGMAIDDVITDKALTMLDVDREGLDYVDKNPFAP